MVTSTAKARITVYKVLCPECGHQGKLAIQGEAVVLLDLLYCARCPNIDNGPMVVYERRANGRWVVRL